MADIELVIKIPEEDYNNIEPFLGGEKINGGFNLFKILKIIKNGISLPKCHGRLKDEDEIIKAIEDRVNFLKENDALFMRLRKDIDILGCIPKIRCEVQTIIEADTESEGVNE